MQIAMDGHQPSTYILSLWLPGHSYEYRTPERRREREKKSICVRKRLSKCIELRALGTVSDAEWNEKEKTADPIFLRCSVRVFRENYASVYIDETIFIERLYMYVLEETPCAFRRK